MSLLSKWFPGEPCHPVLVSVASLRTFANRLVKAFNAAHTGDAP